jgi:Holliday junction resolvasome RuvABC endonuclease subunit
MTEPPPVYDTHSAFILALDPSTTAVGWCYANGNDYVASGVYKPHGRGALGRIRQIRRWLEKHIDSLEPAIVGTEEPTGSHRNARTDRLLGMVAGAVLAECDRAGVEFAFVNAMKVKATGLCKDTAGDVALLIGKKEVSGDEADAVGVWRALIDERGWFGEVTG